MNGMYDISDEAPLKEVGRRIACSRISAKMMRGELSANVCLLGGHMWETLLLKVKRLGENKSLKNDSHNGFAHKKGNDE